MQSAEPIPQPHDPGYRAGLYDPMVASPCRSCDHFRMGVVCHRRSNDPSCPLYIPPESIFSSDNKKTKTITPPKICAVCGKTFIRRETEGLLRYQERKTCSHPCGIILSQKNRKKKCKFPNCNEETTKIYCKPHGKTVSLRKFRGWPKSRLHDPPRGDKKHIKKRNKKIIEMYASRKYLREEIAKKFNISPITVTSITRHKDGGYRNRNRNKERNEKILAAHKSGKYSHRELGEMFGLNKSTIFDVIHNRS